MIINRFNYSFIFVYLGAKIVKTAKVLFSNSLFLTGKLKNFLKWLLIFKFCRIIPCDSRTQLKIIYYI